MSDWALMTNHGHALLCVARAPGMRVREIADCIGVTERAAHRIVSDLCRSGYISRHRNGRRNRYELHPDAQLQNARVAGHTVADLLGGLAPEALADEPVGLSD